MRNEQPGSRHAVPSRETSEQPASDDCIKLPTILRSKHRIARAAKDILTSRRNLPSRAVSERVVNTGSFPLPTNAMQRIPAHADNYQLT